MAYEAHKWKIGEEITSDKLNHIEKGIEEAGLPREITDPQDGQTLKYDAASGKWVNVEGGSGGTTPLIVTATADEEYVVTLNKTWKEIYDAFIAYRPVYVVRNDSYYDSISQVIGVGHDVEYNSYNVYFKASYSENGLFTTTENGYPSSQ